MKDFNWTTREGKEIPVLEMGADHATNCINMLVRNHGANQILWFIINGHRDMEETIKSKKRKEFVLNGDMAQQWNEMHEDAMYEEALGEAYDHQCAFRHNDIDPSELNTIYHALDYNNKKNV
jgi:hypothetical protein